MIINNLLEEIQQRLPEEQLDVLVASGQVRIERIVSKGHRTPAGEWYDQSESEWVCLLSGSATLVFLEPDETVCMKPGDSLLIPPNRKHRVEATDSNADSVWLAVFF